MKVIPLVLASLAMSGCGAQTAPSSGNVKGENLREIIENQIRDNVRESYGELAGQNFSDVDYERFKRDKVPDQIVSILRPHPKFKAAVEKVRAMQTADREAYLKSCRRSLRKTWAEIGEVSPKGTTEAGKRAETDIANAIVDLAEKLLAAPAGEGPKA